MRIELTGRQLPIPPGLRTLITRKFAKVERVLNDTAVSAAVVVTREKRSNVIEVTLHARGEQFFHAVAKATRWETAVTTLVAKVIHQTEKVKGVWQERKRRGPAARSVKTPRSVRRAVSRAAAPVTGGQPASERRRAEPAVGRRVARVRR